MIFFHLGQTPGRKVMRSRIMGGAILGKWHRKRLASLLAGWWSWSNWSSSASGWFLYKGKNSDPEAPTSPLDAMTLEFSWGKLLHKWRDILSAGVSVIAVFRTWKGSFFASCTSLVFSFLKMFYHPPVWKCAACLRRLLVQSSKIAIEMNKSSQLYTSFPLIES